MTRLRRSGAAVTASLLAALAVGGLAYAAFNQGSANPGNSFAAGTLALSDDDGGTAAFDLSGLTPSSPAATRCIRVSYSGSASSPVKLYGSSSGALAPHLDLRVERGTQASPAFPSCTGFTPDATDHIGAGAGVVYDGALSAYPGSHATGIADPPGAPAAWSPGDARSYRLRVSVADTPSAQGLSSTASFTWEARQP